MPKCPNCGQDTLRTEDWACQWCGYPLLSRAYKKIPKTYRQLKEERRPKNKKAPEREPEPEPEPESEPDTEAEAAPEDERESGPEPAPVSIPEDEPEPELATRPRDNTTIQHETEPVPEPDEEQENEEGIETEANEPVPEPRSDTALEPRRDEITEPVVMELTVEEILSAYATDAAAADAKFAEKLLRVTGIVGIIDVKEKLDTYYIRLTDSEEDLSQSVQCMFDKKDAEVLNKLQTGQTATVQGEYNGSLIAIRMAHCALIQ